MGKHVGYLLKTVNDKLKSRADADLKRHNLTLAQSRVLAYVSRNGGEATQKEIEVFLETSHPTVVGIISRMEKNGYLVTLLDERNRRNKLVRLTEKAEAVRSEILQQMERDEAKMLENLSPEDVEQLTRILTTIYKNIE